MNKMRAIIFEGLDGAGKTMLFKAFEADNEHYYACFDRFPTISSFVYDRFFGRYQENVERRRWLEDLLRTLRVCFDVVVVFVDTLPRICFRRRELEESYSFNDYYHQRTEYLNYMAGLRRQGVPVLTVSGERSLKFNIERINCWLMNVEAEHERKLR